jgi:hypothetical protein
LSLVAAHTAPGNADVQPPPVNSTVATSQGTQDVELDIARKIVSPEANLEPKSRFESPLSHEPVQKRSRTKATENCGNSVAALLRRASDCHARSGRNTENGVLRQQVLPVDADAAILAGFIAPAIPIAQRLNLPQAALRYINKQ